jgi:hypothetical protein
VTLSVWQGFYDRGVNDNGGAGEMAALAAEMRRGSCAALFKLFEETGRGEAKTHPLSRDKGRAPGRLF